MKIAVVGGKGGTGKTIIATNLACTFSRRKEKTLIADLDVDNPCVLNTIRCIKTTLVREEQVLRLKPRIDSSKCNLCGRCIQVCPEHALALIPDKGVILIETLCGGCGCCVLVCDQGAIVEDYVPEAVVRYYSTEFFDVLVGELVPGHRRSYVIITKIVEGYRDLFNKYDVVVIDSPPGTGAGVFSILKNSDKVVVVTEPTPVGISDFVKLLKLLEKKFSNKKTIVVINKSTLNEDLTKKIEDMCNRSSLPYVKIPYSETIVYSYVKGIPLMIYEKTDQEVMGVFYSMVEKLTGK